MTEFDSGYSHEPYRSLCGNAPSKADYPSAHFRFEWGPVFHRGRLDGSARVLVIGQDPAQHETIARRILVGAAGHRIQGFLAKLGIDHSYVMINTFLYSVYGNLAASSIKAPGIAGYRNQWLDALLPSNVQVVVALGDAADAAWQLWLAHRAADPNLVYAKIHHPTWPQSASAHGSGSAAALTKQMLVQWNAAIQQLRPALSQPDVTVPFQPYGDAFQAADLKPIPLADLPAGSPDWMTGANWAQRTGATPTAKRFTITVTVPPPGR